MDSLTYSVPEASASPGSSQYQAAANLNMTFPQDWYIRVKASFHETTSTKITIQIQELGQKVTALHDSKRFLIPNNQRFIQYFQGSKSNWSHKTSSSYHKDSLPNPMKGPRRSTSATGWLDSPLCPRLRLRKRG